MIENIVVKISLEAPEIPAVVKVESKSYHIKD